MFLRDFHNQIPRDGGTSMSVALTAISVGPGSAISRTALGVPSLDSAAALVTLPSFWSPLMNASAARPSKSSQNASKLSKILSKFLKSGFSIIFFWASFLFFKVFKNIYRSSGYFCRLGRTQTFRLAALSIKKGGQITVPPVSLCCCE